MPVKIGLELNNSGRAIAWALDLPGCFAYGSDGQEAVVQMARALVAYEQWVQGHAGGDGLALGDFDLRVIDAWEVYTINDQHEIAEEGYEVEAWFLHDWKPLTEQEVQRGLDLLRWSREDLRIVAQGLSGEALDRQYPGERWNIRGILKHVANAEWWYLDRLGMAGWDRAEMPPDVWDRLAKVRDHFEQVLPDLVGQERVVGRDGEFWSPRKLLRRALWHEIDHREHIRKLLTNLQEQ